MTPFDYVIVGGGLQGGLIALAVRHFQPSSTIALVERGEKPGGNHTWSFHSLDLPPEAAGFVVPLVTASWPGYLVRFPGFAREVSSTYSSILSDHFADAITRALDAPGHILKTGFEATSLCADHVTLDDGSTLEGTCVIDARGPAAAGSFSGCGYQKFLGLEVETDRPWPDALPTVMDANVPQDDGFRFLYTLPFDRHRVLVEDTYFSDCPMYDPVRIRMRITEVLHARRVGPWRVSREESGVLPMPWSGIGFGRAIHGPVPSGYAGGWFHPATGYSFPMAVRLALTVARQRPDEAVRAATTLAGRLRARHRFARFLNFLLFRTVVPSERWQIFRRLYRDLPDAGMARFYAMEFTPSDAIRILVGWPPPLAPLRPFRRLEVSSCPLQ